MMPSSNVCPYGEAPNGAREARALPRVIWTLGCESLRRASDGLWPGICRDQSALFLRRSKYFAVRLVSEKKERLVVIGPARFAFFHGPTERHGFHEKILDSHRLPSGLELNDP